MRSTTGTRSNCIRTIAPSRNGVEAADSIAGTGEPPVRLARRPHCQTSNSAERNMRTPRESSYVRTFQPGSAGSTRIGAASGGYSKARPR